MFNIRQCNTDMFNNIELKIFNLDIDLHILHVCYKYKLKIKIKRHRYTHCDINKVFHKKNPVIEIVVIAGGRLLKCYHFYPGTPPPTVFRWEPIHSWINLRILGWTYQSEFNFC